MKLLNIIFSLKERYAIRVILIWIVILSVLYSLLAVLRHDHFQSGAFDLGIYDQAIWQYSKFHIPYNTIKERLILGDHLNLTLPLVSPLFYLWDNVKILLIFQAFFVTFSSLGIYKLSRIRKLSPFISLIVGVVYSLFYGIQTAVFFDFHPIVLAVGMLVWTAYFFEAKKWKLFFISLVLLLLTQENTGIALAGLGLVYIFHKQYRKVSFIFIVGGIMISLLQTKIIGFMSPVGYQYAPQIPKNILQFITGYFDAPEKIENFKYSLFPSIFLPLFSPGAILAILLDLSQYYLTGFSRMWTPFQHHRAILAPFITLGTIEALIILKTRKININYLALCLIFSTLLFQYMFHFPLNKLIKKDFIKKEQWMTDNKELFKTIPENESVASSQNLVPHLSHRDEIYLIWPRKRGEKWWLEFSGKPRYLVVDLHPNQWITQLLETNENFSEAIRNMEKDKKIEIISKVGDARLYKINY